MPLRTPLNVEQSISSFLSTQLQAEGYEVYWHNSRSSEGSGNTTVTLVRKFPPETTNFVSRDTAAEEGYIRVPALSVFSDPAVTQEFRRLGLGEGKFDWDFEVRVEFITDSELEWYTFSRLFTEWMGDPDIRVELLDYEDDLTVSTPTSTEEYLQFTNTDILREYLGETDVLKYYINLRTTATIPG